MNHLFAVGLAVAISVAAGCSHYDQPAPATVTDDMPSYEEFVASHSFPYVASAKRQARLRENYPRLSAGLTKPEVAKILGPPDCSLRLLAKEPSRGWLGSSWIYFLETPDPNSANLKQDISIRVSFGISGKAHWIVSNVAGLGEIGAPGGGNRQPTAAPLSHDRIEALVRQLKPGMSEGEVIAMVVGKPSRVHGNVWMYTGNHPRNADMVSDLAIRFRDGVVAQAWVSWTCIHREIRER